MRELVKGLEDSLRRLDGSIVDVLDVWCGSRPYDELLPPGARCVGLDVAGNPYGVADVVSDDFLPFPDDSFDLVLCVEAFQFVADPAHAVREFERVLRPGGAALVSLVFAFEYDRRQTFEARYTEQQLRALFEGWDDVSVREDGGRAVAWAVLTASLLRAVEQRVRPRLLAGATRPVFAVAYVLVNLLGLALQRFERPDGAVALPMNLTLVARKPQRD